MVIEMVMEVILEMDMVVENVYSFGDGIHWKMMMDRNGHDGGDGDSDGHGDGHGDGDGDGDSYVVPPRV